MLNKTYEIKTNKGSEKWFAIDEGVYNGKIYHLVESCKYGMNVPFMIVDKESGKVVCSNWDYYMLNLNKYIKVKERF